MTWLSRLRPTDRRISQRATKRRRRMATLDMLEDRTLLSNVVTSITKAPTGAITLNVLGDTHNDSFKITDNANGTVTVVGTDNKTQINSLPVGTAYTTSQAISSLNVNLPGNSKNIDHVLITSAAGAKIGNITVTVPGVSKTAPATCVFLTVDDVNSTGSLNVYDAPYTPGGSNNLMGGQLTATVTDSHFTALTIEQDGCCLADYTLDNDIIPGKVNLYQGTANNDSVSVTNSTLGATTIIQFFAPEVTMTSSNGSCTGQGDTVTVDDSQIFSLYVAQNGHSIGGKGGGGMTINIGLESDVEVALTGFGVIALQPYASGGDTIHIESITQYGRQPNNWVNGPPSIYTLQGDGDGETTIVDSSVVFGNITVIQGNGAGDSVLIAADTIGYTLEIGPFTQDFYGWLTVIQGNGYADIVTVNSEGSEFTLANTFNNVYILQGNGTVGAPDGCCGQASGFDQVFFDESFVTSDLYIFQNVAFDGEDSEDPEGDGSGDGNNTISIGTIDSVSVGSWTYLYQGGANNTVNLGGASAPAAGIDFETTFLDIWTGAGGGGFVFATNTVVDVGSFLGFDWVINGGGDGNTYSDGGGNSPSPLSFGPGYSG